MSEAEQSITFPELHLAPSDETGWWDIVIHRPDGPFIVGRMARPINEPPWSDLSGYTVNLTLETN